MTPRERAEALVRPWKNSFRAKEIFAASEMTNRIEEGITEHVRALLADEATVEAVANAIARMDEEMSTGGDERSGYRFLASAALAALRSKAGV